MSSPNFHNRHLAPLHENSKKRRVLVSFCMKTAEKACVNFGRCFGNQGLAEAAEKINSFLASAPLHTQDTEIGLGALV